MNCNAFLVMGLVTQELSDSSDFGKDENIVKKMSDMGHIKKPKLTKQTNCFGKKIGFGLL